jgi:HEAT repeat protein
MADGMAEAADMLRQLLAAKSENVRLGAARSLLELGVKLREAVELEERVRLLEEQAAAATKRKTL